MQGRTSVDGIVAQDGLEVLREVIQRREEHEAAAVSWLYQMHIHPCESERHALDKHGDKDAGYRRVFKNIHCAKNKLRYVPSG
jgi:hypothetical protein